jgi:aminobenzoyl-glutamate utilization protein A
MVENERMGVPGEEVLSACQERALSEGANSELVKKMTGGCTGVVATLDTGRPGKTVALRFDMDCNDVTEAADDKHRPNREGFASLHKGCMHACGHDGHTSVGLGVAEVLAKLQDKLVGKIKLIFQPAEEGVRGARAMAAKGVTDDVDFLIGSHFMMPKIGFLAYDVQNFLATSKLNVDFKGVAAHAGGAPEQGKNALLAAAAAALNLHAITRHSGGSSRINVGVLRAGTGRNVVPAQGHMEIETRGATTEINDFIRERAEQVIKGAAMMYDTEVNITPMGSAPGGNNSPELAEKIRQAAQRLELFDNLTDTYDMCGSEDFMYFMERMQKQGKQAAYIIIGASLAAINHNDRFDFDEQAMVLAVSLLSAAVADLLEG